MGNVCTCKIIRKRFGKAWKKCKVITKMDIREKRKKIKEEIKKDMEEPNEMKWKATYMCEMKRSRQGFWCSYVHIPCSHPLSSRKWWGYVAGEKRKLNQWIKEPLGGVTFLSKKARSQSLILGFDCGHFDDIIPERFDSDWSKIEVYDIYIKWKSYKSASYVKGELQKFIQEMLELDPSYWQDSIVTFAKEFLICELASLLLNYLSLTKETIKEI